MLMNAFIYDDMVTHLIVNNGKVDVNANKAEWKAGLTYIRSLAQEGLLDPAAFTQNWEAVQKIGNNDPEILGVGGLFPWYLSAAAQNDYWAVGPLTGPDGVQYADYLDYNGGGANFVLTNKASKEVQIAAIKLANWFYTEEGMYRQMGLEGVDWRKPEPGEVAVDKNFPPLYFKILLKPDEKPHNNDWEKIFVGYYPKAWGVGWVQSLDTKTPEGFERKLLEATWLYDGKQAKEIFPSWGVWVDPALADEVAMLKKNITDYIDQNAAAFVTGSKSIENDWDAYVKGLDDLNLKRYLEIMQQEYDAYLSKVK